MYGNHFDKFEISGQLPAVGQRLLRHELYERMEAGDYWPRYSPNPVQRVQHWLNLIFTVVGAFCIVVAALFANPFHQLMWFVGIIDLTLYLPIRFADARANLKAKISPTRFPLPCTWVFFFAVLVPRAIYNAFGSTALIFYALTCVLIHVAIAAIVIARHYAYYGIKHPSVNAVIHNEWTKRIRLESPFYNVVMPDLPDDDRVDTDALGRRLLSFANASVYFPAVVIGFSLTLYCLGLVSQPPGFDRAKFVFLLVPFLLAWLVTGFRSIPLNNLIRAIHVFLNSPWPSARQGYSSLPPESPVGTALERRTLFFTTLTVVMLVVTHLGVVTLLSADYRTAAACGFFVPSLNEFTFIPAIKSDGFMLMSVVAAVVLGPLTWLLSVHVIAGRSIHATNQLFEVDDAVCHGI